MRWIAIFFILFSQAACSLYQSDGREAIEDNTANLVTTTGFDVVLKVAYECIQSGSEPKEISGPIEVLDHQFEEAGYSAYLIQAPLNRYVLVYHIPAVTPAESHYYCYLDLRNDHSIKKQQAAIRLGVQLLAE